MPTLTPAPPSSSSTPSQSRRPLAPNLLATALKTSKPLILSDTPTTAPTSRGRAPVPSASTARINSLAWSPLGTLLATADNKCLRVWNPEKPGVRLSTELKPASASTSAAAASVTGARGRAPPVPASLGGTERVAWRPTREAELASVGSDGILRFWDVRARGACVGEVKIGGEGYDMCWRPDGEEVVVSRKDDTIIPISRHTLSPLSHHAQTSQINAIAFTNSGTELLLTTGDSVVRILDYPSMDTLTTLTPHTSSITCVAHSPSGRHLAFGGSDALLTLWSTADLTCRYSFASLPGALRSVSFSFDGAYVVGGCVPEEQVGLPVPSFSGAVGGAAAEGSGIKVFCVESGEEILEIPTSAAAPLVQWHPSRYLLAWSGELGGVKILGTGGL